jgi:hypothetical protein
VKFDLIAFSSLAISALSPAFALSTAPHHDERWNPQHIEGSPAEVRSAVARVCGSVEMERWPFIFNSHGAKDPLIMPATRHSITSSASSCIELGTTRLSALAVLRLITNSNFVGCKTGKSVGLAPLRIRPA